MKLQPGKRYTREQLREAMTQAQAHELQMTGYVLQFDTVSQTYAIVPWQQAAGGESFGTLRTPRQYSGTPDFGELPKIQKRTPMERVASLTKRLIDDCRTAGTVPGLDDARIKFILGESWKAGRSDLTAEDIRRVAAHFLQDAENKHEAKLSKQITRHED